VVQAAILTHPDSDHASGMRTVIEDLDVRAVWMHRPWKYWKDCESYIQDGRITRASWEKRLQDAYSYAYQIELIANRKRIPINHAHQGEALNDGEQNVLTVLGPSKDFYLSLIEESEKTPAMREYAKAASRIYSGEKSLTYEDLTFESEHLSDDEESTSPENDMSIILFLQVTNARVLLTGDAGTMGLYKAINYATQEGLDLKDLSMFQVPHHGSRHNLSKGILSRITSPSGIISCTAGDSPHHPSPVITNALIRRNINPFSTNGKTICHRAGDAPPRVGWTPISTVPFQSSFHLSD